MRSSDPVRPDVWVPSRRGFLGGAVGLAAGGLLAACGSSSGSSSSGSTTSPSAGGSSAATVTPVKFQLSWLTTTEFAGSYLAVDKGYYKANGLDVTLIPGGPNTAVEPLLLAGKAFVGGSNADATAAARAKGGKLKIFGARYQKNPFCVLSLADKPISSPQEMIGKKIGVAAANQTAFNALCKINGVDISKVNVVPVQFDPTPVANKEVDGQVVYITDEPSILELKGIKTHTYLFADFKYDVYADCYVTTEDTLATKSDLLVGFLKAERQGWQYDLDHPQEGTDLQVKLYGKKLGTDPAQAAAINLAQKQLILTDTTKDKGLFWIDAAEVDANVRTLAVGGITTTKELFTTEILDKL
jgi:ABC-type nitrate/sulfonate/bicarbonate transport system substrate-binding protein